MDEKSLKSRIKKLSIAVVIISSAILIAVVAASYNLRTILQDALFSQMESETEQYGINIRRQMDADIQTLNTLASFIQYGNMDTDSFIKGFQLSREYNDFDGLGFFGRPDMNIDIGIMITSDAVEEVSAEALDGNMAAVVQDAWNGGVGYQGYTPKKIQMRICLRMQFPYMQTKKWQERLRLKWAQTCLPMCFRTDPCSTEAVTSILSRTAERFL